ncbi:DUF2490 domain-containing protein [Flammeovirga pectinis]|uniref:DUF2490 domain-containing protein n=1 Tax=Flammeovirga pectinis TaxID=2494373 RepID=A0A3Q9FPL8_9BACT|nr:DUF2490 domain-containing protein [Flammeovirga pectinis]
MFNVPSLVSLHICVINNKWRTLKKILKISIAIYCFLISDVSIAQISDDKRLWLHYFNSIKLNKKWSVDTDAAYLHQFDLTANRIQARSGVKYKINKNFSVRIGMGYFYVFDPEGANVSEIRPNQDIIGKHYISRNKSWFFTQRARFEEQFLTTTIEDELIKGKDQKNRLRYSYMIRKAINSWTFGIGGEMFINFNDKSTNAFVNKHRAYAVINKKINDNLALEAQYIREDSFKYQQGSIYHADVLRLCVKQVIHTKK